jgi:hypothetical protein
MKKFILLLILIVASVAVNAQDTMALYQMNKVQLSTIYLQEANRVTKQIPLCTFDSTMADVPKSKYLNKKFQRVAKKVESYNQTVLKDLAEIIPYADKKELIEAIIYLRKL